MAHIAYKTLLYFLRGLVYGKRALVWVGKRLLGLLAGLEQGYQNTLGFRIYKIFFAIQKQLERFIPLSWNGGVLEIIGRRGTLQLLLFWIAIIIMIPHSKLYTRVDNTVPGRGTVLFALVGPGDQNFAFEEEIVETATDDASTPAAWRQGAVVVDNSIRNTQTRGPQEISGTSVGGGALTKPTILPGNSQIAGSDPTIPRTQVVLYTVQPGDVIGAIADQYSVSVETILWANKLTARSRIHPGDQLTILPVDGVSHTVKKGDTVGRIARLYKSDESKVIAFNRLQSGGSDIVVGETLIIPDGVPVAPVVAPAPRKATVFSRIAAPPASVEAPAGSGYIWPAGVRRITQYYGLRHNGVDIGGPVGTPLYAARDGVVVKSQCGWNGGYGCHIVLDHGGGYTTLYGHASQLFVNVGDPVTQGQTIAAMGSTGNSSGPHVHFEVRLNGARQNPLQFVR